MHTYTYTHIKAITQQLGKKQDQKKMRMENNEEKLK